MRLVHGTIIKEELRQVAPERIAVAYIGLDWQSFVDVSTLNEIIVAPTAGSSADAIAELVRKLGWDRVHFLRELHAKIYIGQTSAAVGSFNLTANGLSGHALSEAGYIVETSAALDELRTLYDSLKEQATRQFGTQAGKETQLSALRTLNEKMRNAGADIPQSGAGRSLAEYEPVTDTDFYCTYYGTEELEFDVAALRKHEPEKFSSPDADPHALTAMHVSFLDKDDVHPGRWMLLWQAGEDDDVPKSLQVDWMYVNAVIPKGAIDKINKYTKVALQWKKSPGKGAPPFAIGKPEKAALRKVLASGDFPEFLPPADGKQWKLERTFPRFRQFVAAWKEAAAS